MLPTADIVQAGAFAWGAARASVGAGAQEQLEEMMFPDADALLADLTKSTPPRLRQLNKAVAKLVDGYGMVSFSPLDVSDEDRCGAPCVGCMLRVAWLIDGHPHRFIGCGSMRQA